MRTSGLAAKHSVFLYSGQEEFVSWLAPFVSDGVDQGEAVIAVASEDNLQALREALGPVPPSVRFVHGSGWYARSSDTMGRWASFVDDQLAVGKPGVRIIGEVVWPLDPSSYWEMTRFEAASTLAWVDRPALVVCPYNTETLPDAVIEAGLSTHPGVVEHGRPSANGRFRDARSLVEESLPSFGLPVTVGARRFEPYDVAGAAAFVEAEARRNDVAERRVQSLVSAVSEVVLNAFVHAGTPVHLSAWAQDGRFTCQIEDEGAGVLEPEVGYQPPSGNDGRWGLWLARSRTDAIEVGLGAHGNAVRLTVGGRGISPDLGHFASRL